MIDIHVHILPELDDGAPDMETALTMSELAVKSGVTAVIATPHSNMPDYFENYYGEGLYHVANTLINTGHKVKVKAYSGYRHEVHNEPDLRDEVEAGLISFIEDTLNK